MPEAENSVHERGGKQSHIGSSKYAVRLPVQGPVAI